MIENKQILSNFENFILGSTPHVMFISWNDCYVNVVGKFDDPESFEYSRITGNTKSSFRNCKEFKLRNGVSYSIFCRYQDLECSFY